MTCVLDWSLSSVHSRAAAGALPADAKPQASERRIVFGPGGLLGELDFFLQRPRRCLSGLLLPSCSLWEAGRLWDGSCSAPLPCPL